jgi:carbon monoxide dehydrogenase subunit G
MIETEGSILVNRPVDDVFAFVSDVSNDPKWDPDLLQVERRFEEPIHEGATFDVHFKPFLGASTCAMKVTGYEQNRREVREGRPGLMQARATFLFEPVESGTRIIRRTQIQPLGVLRLMEPFMRGELRKRQDAALRKLKAVLEAQS